MPLLSRHLDMNIRLLPALPSPSSWLSVAHRLWSKCAAMIFISVDDAIQPCGTVYGQFPDSTFPIAATAEPFQASGACITSDCKGKTGSSNPARSTGGRAH